MNDLLGTGLIAAFSSIAFLFVGAGFQHLRHTCPEVTTVTEIQVVEAPRPPCLLIPGQTYRLPSIGAVSIWQVLGDNVSYLSHRHDGLILVANKEDFCIDATLVLEPTNRMIKGEE